MTLTEFSNNVRKYAPFAILGVLLFLVLFYSVRLVLIVIESRRVEKIATNAIFGTIRKPFIKEASSSGNLSFTLDTIEGTPTTATQAAQVFFLPPPQTRFGYREKVFLMAKTLGFSTEESAYKLVGQEAVFSETSQKLSVDISGFNFNYEYSLDTDPELIRQAITPQEEESKAAAAEFLQEIGRYPSELAQGQAHALFWRYEPLSKRVILLDRNIDANLVEVDFFSSEINGLPVLSPKYFTSQNHVFLVFTQSGYKIVKAQVKFYERSPQQIGVYPLKNGETAYKELQEGKGLVVSNPKNREKIIIRKMFVGYLDPDVYQDYLQPVYVFLGDDSFVAYVPAVSNEFLTE